MNEEIKDFEPYDDEWKKEMMQFAKPELVILLKNKLLKIKQLESEKAELIEFMLKVESHFGPYTQGACRAEIWELCKDLKQKYTKVKP